MSYRKLLVPFSGSDKTAGILPAALQLAARFKATSDVVFVRPEPYQVLPYLGDSAPGIMVSEIVDATKTAADTAANRLRNAIDQAARDCAVMLVGEGTPPADQASVRYVEVSGDATDIVAEQSRLADLVIFVGGTEQSQLGLPGALGSVLMNTTRPILVLPSVDYAGTIGTNVAIAWDGSAEAANAVKGALPFLQDAKSVKIMNVQHNLSQEGVQADIAEALGDYLDLHGIAHTEAYLDPQGKSTSEVILEQAGLAGCDLLVMGGYGHSRVREMLLGGVTQYMLEQTTVPILMAH